MRPITITLSTLLLLQILSITATCQDSLTFGTPSIERGFGGISPKRIEQSRLITNEYFKWKEAYNQLWQLDSVRVEMLIISQKIMGIQTNDLKEFDRQAQTWLVIQKAQQEELRDSRSIIQNLELKIGRGKKIILVATPIIFGGGIYLGYQMAKKKD